MRRSARRSSHRKSSAYRGQPGIGGVQERESHQNPTCTRRIRGWWQQGCGCGIQYGGSAQPLWRRRLHRWRIEMAFDVHVSATLLVRGEEYLGEKRSGLEWMRCRTLAGRSDKKHGRSVVAEVDARGCSKLHSMLRKEARSFSGGVICEDQSEDERISQLATVGTHCGQEIITHSHYLFRIVCETCQTILILRVTVRYVGKKICGVGVGAFAAKIILSL